MVDIAALTSPGFCRSCRTALRRCVLSCRLCIAALWCRIHLSRLLCITTLRRSIRLPWRIAALRCRISLPRRLLQLPYDLLNRLNRRKLLKQNTDLTTSIRMDDYRIEPVGDGCFDLFYIAVK